MSKIIEEVKELLKENGIKENDITFDMPIKKEINKEIKKIFKLMKKEIKLERFLNTLFATDKKTKEFLCGLCVGNKNIYAHVHFLTVIDTKNIIIVSTVFYGAKVFLNDKLNKIINIELNKDYTLENYSSYKEMKRNEKEGGK